ncbi:hypothetical protein AVI51_15685 (plasmid) [Piscirickettsia salmonis]|uniref:Uncharacterized protein n=1 Tax=Piscirickettsia salmonis TaxID=1238 RepID=A0A9Q6LI99_PISSA|nr:hypothetical protein [Piscirickettsia salmonis]APS46097.1 hypothetical protein AVI48_16975 [Piscirickettsia salmonis]APS49141.1 hypothetical protein AVI49_15885 [Piscirickettsia salmonis]APS52401.1 hypothetical protein AVI50_16250 [Piscirickettsia salmonis]APS55552.1 hypothetical protein AVI51_15685 [Piscirickettsia salmonis]APS58928.1 hypothetical protein AVI52_16975 [Piscirickettsia salmonis]
MQKAVKCEAEEIQERMRFVKNNYKSLTVKRLKILWGVNSLNVYQFLRQYDLPWLPIDELTIKQRGRI